MPYVGGFYFYLVEGNRDVVQPENFRHRHQTLQQARDYIESIFAYSHGQITSEYWAITLQEGAPAGPRLNPEVGRQRVTLADEAAAGRRRTRRHRSWKETTPKARADYVRWGRYRGMDQAAVRRYYDSGRPLGLLRPTPANLMNDPFGWRSYIAANRGRIDARMGKGTAEALLGAAADQQHRRTAMAYCTYVAG